MANPDTPFEAFLAALAKATNETQKREAFIIVAARGFADTELATDLALGAEYQVRFKASGLVRRGAVDSFYGNLIIEFENNLSATYEHALDQLRGYVAGAWTEDGNTARPYLAVATDGERWEVHAPTLTDPAGPIAPENVSLGKPIEEWVPTGTDDAAGLREFLNRLLFRKTLLKPTAANFAKDFGLSSPAFTRTQAGLERKLKELAGDPQLQVLQTAWKSSLQIAYGSVETDDQLFAKHTYLAALARLLVWTALERRPLKPDEIDDVLSGLYFRGKSIANLVEDDFFRWYGIPSATDAAPLWVALSKQLLGYDLAAVKEDILKPLYEELVDPETKHELGEFYTPDWLATGLVRRLLGDHDWKGETPAVLDPSCGSGTFIRATIDLVRARRKKLTAPALLDEILSRVMGIDVHPLAVTIARATYLLAIQDLIGHAKGPITLPVFLANALNMPPLKRQMTFTEEIVLDIDGKKYPVPIDLVYHGADYDRAIEEVLDVGRAYGKPTTTIAEAADSLAARLGTAFDHYDPSGNLVRTLGKMSRHIAELIRARRNSVHGFLLKNHYRPSMLRGSFDYIVGNPPWLTVGQIAVEHYKETVIRLTMETNIASRSAGEQSHTELATVFLTAAVGNFLKTEESTRPRVGLVMPRSLFTAKHHRLLREGAYNQRFDVVEIWDLDGVHPLFNVPACVIFVAANTKPLPKEPKAGLRVVGKLPEKDVPESVANGHLVAEKVTFQLLYLAKRSAWVVSSGAHTGESGKKAPSKSENAYRGAFRQGAILYPQTLLVVRPQSKTTRTGSVRVVTDTDATASAKKSKDVSVNHMVDVANLFATAAADHILPYTLLESLWTVVLPTVADPGESAFGPVGPDTLRRSGRIHTAAWLEWAEAQWEAVRKQGDKGALAPRLDTFGHLSAHNAQLRYVVLYAATGNRTVASVVDTKSLELPFVARDRTFWTSFATAAEAHYVVAFLNSDYAAEQIEDFMNRGLFGGRDINKRLLEVRWPKFDPDNPLHKELVEASAALAKEAHSLRAQVPKGKAGIERRWIREHLSKEKLAQVERLVRRIAQKKKKV